MKNFAGFLIAAIVGGVASTGMYRMLDKEQAATNTTKTDKISQQSQLVNYPRVVSETSVDFTRAAKSSLDAVVHVKTTVLAETGSPYYWNPFQEFFFGHPSHPQQKQYQEHQLASGSGVIISADGYIVTNNHVIKNAESIEITMDNRRTYLAELIGTDPTTDLALLKIDDTDLPFIPYGNSDEAEVGEWVLAVGNPFNLTSTVTAGIISAKGRDINILENDHRNGLSAIESFIQTDAAVNPGNSGGALVATTGKLLGINTAIKSNTGSYTGYSFAIPVNIVKKVVDDLLEFGEVQRAFIGVSIQEMTTEIAENKHVDNISGVYVAGLSKGGAAIDAGIEEGDIITKIGNVTVKDVPELQEQVSKFRPGNEIVVTVNRDGREIEVPVTLKNKFGSTDLVKREHPLISKALGAHFTEISNEDKRKLNIKNGVKITDLNGGKLRSAGIKEGFIITKVDKKAVNNFDELANALNDKDGGVLIEGVYPNGMKAYYGFGM